MSTSALLTLVVPTLVGPFIWSDFFKEIEMSILDSIKSERKLSFDHWRFRILHWAYNVKNPQSPADTGLPQFLYTHYCPLFHLTNLIALLSPLILLIRFIILIGRALGAALSMLFDMLPVKGFYDLCRSLLPEKKEVKISGPTIESEKLKLIEIISKWVGTFEDFWDFYINRFKVLSKDEAKAIFDEYMPKFEEARERAKIRKKKWRDRIIFWTNFSRVFIKWAMNIAYFALTGLLLYLTYLFAGMTLGALWAALCWCGDFIIWLFTDTISWTFVLFVGKLIIWMGLSAIAIAMLTRFGFVQKFSNAFLSGLGYITPPSYIVSVPFRWIINGFHNLCEFIAMFYEENCPPIKIVSKEEAVVESVAQNGEEV
jgi:hypothetical protein